MKTLKFHPFMLFTVPVIAFAIWAVVVIINHWHVIAPSLK